MKITKPDDVLFLQGYHVRGGKHVLMVTVAYVVDADGSRMSEQDVWPWMLAHFAEECFDAGFKKDRAVFGVAGAAYAPAGQTVKAMSVRAQVGSLHKTLHVYGDRFWNRGLAGWQISPATGFTSMPITLSRALGGDAYLENPYGRGYFQEGEPTQGLPLPNIELPDDPIVSPSDRPGVATFSVLPAGARSRMQWVGQVDGAWQRERFPWLPDDTDARWFDGVPNDQGHDAYWLGTETWSVHGMNAAQAEVSGQLPGLRPRLLVRRQQCAGQSALAAEVGLDLDTVWLFPNEQRVMVMYRAAVAVTREDAADISALGVFTELANDVSRTTAEWDQHWHRHDDGADTQGMTLIPPVATQYEQVLAEHRIAVQKSADGLRDEIQQSLDEGAQQANQAMERMQKDMSFTGGLDLPRIEAPRIRPESLAHTDAVSPAVSTDEFEASLKADIQASLDEGQTAMETTVRDIAKQTGLDADELLEQIEADRHNASFADGKTLLEHIADIDMPEDIREDLLSQAQEFQSKMDDMQARFDVAFGAPVAVSGQASGQTVAPVLLPVLTGKAEGSQAGSATTDDVNMAVDASSRSGSVLTVEDVQARVAAGEPLSDTVLTDLNLKGVDFSTADFTAAIITDCDFNAAVLCNAIFDRTAIKGCVFDNADLTASSWREADVEDTGFVRTRLEQARLTDATFLGCRFEHADLSHAVLDDSSLGESTFDSARFIQASLAMTTIWACSGMSVDFSRGRLAGVRIDSECDFPQGGFAHADLRGCSMQKSSFQNANFNEADLSDAFVCDCDLSGTTGWRTTAQRTDFKNSRFSNARWIAANLFESSFDHAVLENLDLSGANLHAIETRTAFVRGVQVKGALLSRAGLLQEHATGGGTG